MFSTNPPLMLCHGKMTAQWKSQERTQNAGNHPTLGRVLAQDNNLHTPPSSFGQRKGADIGPASTENSAGISINPPVRLKNFETCGGVYGVLIFGTNEMSSECPLAMPQSLPPA